LYLLNELVTLQSGFVFQEKLIQAIKKIKHEIDECYEAEKDAFVDAVGVEVRIDLLL